ncbi:uncharacterized protein [Hyperolius riggenbachi]|uniref:uncharacterized protein n=1 Tax=Hyperolius riggenbachi TaxID=752182 RepID=UPI0035A33EA4
MHVRLPYRSHTCCLLKPDTNTRRRLQVTRMDLTSEWIRRDWVKVRGVPIIYAFAQNWDHIDNFQAREDDVLVATYPKSGTTWMSEIVDLILNDGDVEKSRRQAIHMKVPMLEFCVPGVVPPGSQILDSLPSPRIIKTHLPISLLPKSLLEKNVKVIYVARNPKDVVVSYYHFDKMNQLHPDPGTWADYLERFMQGNAGFGSWWTHVREWWDLRHQPNVLYAFYEDMLEDPKREVRKVVRFLGKDLSEEVVERICQHTSFKAMKENPLTNYTAVPSSVMDQSVSPFMRKGISGDWKNHFTVAQSKRFDEYYKNEMSGTDLTFQRQPKEPTPTTPLSNQRSRWAVQEKCVVGPHITEMDAASNWTRRELGEVRGVPLLCPFTQGWDRIDGFQARDEDILITTYPKSGTTWMCEVVDLILHDGDLQMSQRGPISSRVFMLEFYAPGLLPNQAALLQSVPSPRVIKTHLPVSLLPKSFWEKKAKMIYMVRNPKDVAVSFYYFDKMNQLHPEPGAFGDYLERFMQGNVGYGPWGTHVKEWWNCRQQNNILYIFYEDMLEDPRREIRKVMTFLGKDLSDEILELIVQHTSFTAMKQNPLTNYTVAPASLMDHSISPFMRKGTCGDWKNHFTAAQSEKFDEYYRREMSGTDLFPVVRYTLDSDTSPVD